MAEGSDEHVYGEYLRAYAYALGGANPGERLYAVGMDGLLTIQDESTLAAVTLAAYDAQRKAPPRTKADLVAEVRRLQTAPESPAPTDFDERAVLARRD